MVIFFPKKSKEEYELEDQVDNLKRLEHDLYWARYSRKSFKGAVRNALTDTRRYNGKNLEQAKEMLIICRNEEHSNYVAIKQLKEDIVNLKNKIAHLRSKINKILW